ncbi:TlpA family protein disulfide reductase [Sphingobacterium kitahiroshimense]|uniref:TlpA disulfide reductase family protein n=1 Tax=Sphingobacterium kitahiroshimense TaxID=470446 RepID=A0ABV0BR29_9SPHI
MQKTCNRESYALFPRERTVPIRRLSIGLYFKTDRNTKILKSSTLKNETTGYDHAQQEHNKSQGSFIKTKWLGQGALYDLLLPIQYAFKLVLRTVRASKVIAMPLVMVIVMLSMFSLSAQTPRKDSGVDGLETVTPIGVDYYVPEQFWSQQLKVYSNGDTAIISMAQYRGKPLIIDFWSLSCASCITKFPKLFELQNKFQGNIKILLINKEGKDAIHRMPNDFLRDNNLPTVYDDCFLNELFPHRSIPHYIWITPRGRVSAITSAEFVNEQWVAGFIDNCLSYEMPN